MRRPSPSCRSAARGRIAEIGDHAALIRAGGLYAELYELQRRAYR
jgi:ATP-binding cassette subfamily B protein